MLLTTVFLFAIAAVLGVILINKVLQNKETPRGVVYGHGAAAALALILLIIAYRNLGESMLFTSLLIFLIAAIGGFIMFSRDFSGKPIPNWLAIVHAAAAVTAFVLLLFGTFA